LGPGTDQTGQTERGLTCPTLPCLSYPTLGDDASASSLCDPKSMEQPGPLRPQTTATGYSHTNCDGVTHLYLFRHLLVLGQRDPRPNPSTQKGRSGRPKTARTGGEKEYYDGPLV
jgi:hypothetical protein